MAEIAPATILSEEEQFTQDTAEADTAEAEADTAEAEADTAEAEAEAPIEAADDDAAELTGDQEATETAHSEASALEQDTADQEPPADTQ